MLSLQLWTQQLAETSSSGPGSRPLTGLAMQRGRPSKLQRWLLPCQCSRKQLLPSTLVCRHRSGVLSSTACPLAAPQASALRLMRQQSPQVGMSSFNIKVHQQKFRSLLPSVACTAGSVHPAGQVKRQRHEHQPLPAAAKPAVGNMLESDRRVALLRLPRNDSKVMHY